MLGAHRDRHLQHRRAGRHGGGAGGGRVRRREARRGRYEYELLESGAPGRNNVFCRMPGADRERGALLVHGHLDVVPAEPAEWSVHPFSGAVQDGYVWGRGAVDMKDMVAMTLAVVRRFRRDGVVPPRDLVFAFVADEEAGGALGAQWLVENRPDLFEGCTEAVGEVGRLLADAERAAAST